MKWRVILGLAGLVWLLTSDAALAASPCEAQPEPLSDGGFKVEVVPDSAPWEPLGKEVRFTLKGPGIPAPDMKIDVCFRWHGINEPKKWHLTPPPRVVEASPNQVTLAVLVPRELGDDWPNWFAFGQVEYTGFGLVPLADMHIVVTASEGEWRKIDAVEQVGITNRMFALIPAIGTLVIAWWLLLAFGRSRSVRGGAILRVISSRDGYASLSQLQIMLWTIVLAGGVIYVIALSGKLIDIPGTALGLLGISGLATLGTKFKAASTEPTAAPNPPGATTGLAVSGVPTDTSVTLTWVGPAGADPTTAYTVQVREVNTLPWSTAAASVAAPPYAVTGLAPNRVYQFQVSAVNSAGSGPASAPVQVTTAGAPVPAPGVPGAVGGLIAQLGPMPESSVRLNWAAPAPAPDSFVVQYRPAGRWSWSTARSTNASPYVVTGLAGATDYEFQVFAVNSGISGPPSTVATARTAPRTPRWSDLVITDERSEIDVTRVQMLLFTVIAAVFVAMQLFDENRIPDIPAGILTLMGLSNGVYLGAKFVPGSR
jgi:hypothetical protein